MLVKLVCLALLLVAVMLFVRTMYEEISTRWNRKIASYAAWLSIEFQLMFEDMSVERARRLITICIVGAFVIGFLFGDSVAQRAFFGVLFALAGYFGPWALVSHMRKRRIQAIDDQLVDALQMMSN